MSLESNNQRWTSSDDLTLRKMSKENTVAEIAEVLGRTRASVSGRKYTLGLKGRLRRSTKIGASIVPHSVGTKVRSTAPSTPETTKKKSKASKQPKGKSRGGNLSVSIKGSDLKALIAAANAEGMKISIKVS